jgi:4-amino-4-deoxychorismate lyase
MSGSDAISDAISDAMKLKTRRVFVGEEAVAENRVGELLMRSRGMAYGDGVFETMRADHGTIHWWPAHWARLERGAQRLGIPAPARARIEAERDALLRDAPDAAIKLMLIRGDGGRGYAPSRDAAPLWWLSAHALPTPLAHALRLRWCETRLSAQARLAGIKHCNRLEQVLARAEWGVFDESMPTDDEAACDDGLMRDEAGNAIAATSANLFVFREAQGAQGGWLTPRVDRCGIAGICREWAFTALGAREAVLSPDDVTAADAIFLCNALRGILPVAQLGARRWSRHPATTEALRRLATAHPGFGDASSENDAGKGTDFSEVHP